MSGLKYDLIHDLDDPKRTMQHAEIIKSKPFLKRIYLEWYENFSKEIKNLPAGKLIEIGSGGGFLKDVIPSVITSDILPLDNCDMTFSAENLPFADGELSAIFMVNVLHHITDPSLFFKEAEKKLVKDGKIIMIEPANSFLSRFIYRNFHHEPFETEAGWTLTAHGPLSASNQAIPYILFERDREKFNSLFPSLQVMTLNFHTPLRYILSGGVSRKSLVPDQSFSFFKFIEGVLKPFMRFIGMFETIRIVKT